MTTETITPNDDLIALSDRALLERVAKQLDHIDQMTHEHGQMMAQLEPLLPLIPRALALLDPGASLRRTFGKRGRNAVQESAPAPVHVGQTSPDRPPMGAREQEAP